MQEHHKSQLQNIFYKMLKLSVKEDWHTLHSMKVDALQ
jgi:hypothetical protein